ncbi:MAG: hypothetical protein JXR96_19045 [Deltaproteobacteria bacterium]|nr:hypothetical protein [Deltaproteobacteria bacterium]
MPGVGIISNRNARLNKLYPQLKDRLAFIVGRGGELASTGSLDDARTAIEEFRRVAIDIIAISGGDGTAHRTIELLIDIYGTDQLPPVLLLPTGTQNMVPGSFGIRSSGVTTLLLALARYRHNVPLRCIRRNVLKVNDHYSFMFGVGIAPRFLELYYGRDATTPMGAAKLLGENAIGAIKGTEGARRLTAPLPMEYRIDDGPVQHGNPHSVFASFVEEVSLRFRLFPRAGWDPGVFEVLMAKDSPFLVAKALPFLWMGSLRELEGFDRHVMRSLEMVLENDEPYTLDGEVYEPVNRFRITAGPEMRFVVPGFHIRPRDSRLRTEKVGPWDMQFIV